MPTVKSLRDFAFDSVQAFLYQEGFPHSDELSRGMAYLSSNIGEYQEEGTELHPEILITTDLRSIASILPNRTIIPIASGPVASITFQKALKACAPLARDNWVIYFEITEQLVAFGVLASGISIFTPSPFFHLREIFPDLEEPTVYIKALKPKVLMVKGRKNELIISFSLEEYIYEIDDSIETLATFITRDVDEALQGAAKDLFIGLIEQACEDSHGCLIAVLENAADTADSLMSEISNGICIPDPIDVVEYLSRMQQSTDPDAPMALKSICGVVKRMIIHDGIAVFSSNGRLLAYNLFVPSNDEETKDVVGGARSRAYHKLSGMPLFSCVFFRSQDGLKKVSVREKRQS